LPLARLSFQQAVRVNLVIAAALILGCGWLWTRWLVGPAPALLELSCLASVPLWPPTLFVLGMGQNSTLVFVAMTGCVGCLRRSRDGAAGVCLALVTVKPHLGVALVAFAAAWSLRRRRYGLGGGLLAALATAAVLVALARPTIWTDYARFLAAVTPPSQYHGATIDGWGRMHLGPWFGVISWPLWLASVIAAAALGWAGGDPEGLPHRAALAGSLALAGVPHAFSYDFVLLLPVFLAGVGMVLKGGHGSRTGRFVVVTALAAGLLLAGKRLGWAEPAYWPVPWLMALLAITVRPRRVRVLSAAAC
jgi:hypothetical protein